MFHDVFGVTAQDKPRTGASYRLALDIQKQLHCREVSADYLAELAIKASAIEEKSCKECGKRKDAACPRHSPVAPEPLLIEREPRTAAPVADPAAEWPLRQRVARFVQYSTVKDGPCDFADMVRRIAAYLDISLELAQTEFTAVKIDKGNEEDAAHA